MWLLVHRGVLIWVELYLFVSQWSHFECITGSRGSLGRIKCDLKTPWNQKNEMVLFTRSHVNAAKFISVKWGDHCQKG